MDTKYFSEEELKDYSDQGLIDKEIKIRSNKLGSICIAGLEVLAVLGACYFPYSKTYYSPYTL